jgi:hypothetical protein
MPLPRSSGGVAPALGMAPQPLPAPQLARNDGKIALSPEEKRSAVREELKLDNPSDKARGELELQADQYRKLLQLRHEFKDEFAGNRFEALGNLENRIDYSFGDTALGRMVATPGQDSFWRKYAALRNEIRHSRFGGALSEHELAEFLKQDITPGGSPSSVRGAIDEQLWDLSDKMRRRIEYWQQTGADAKALRKMVGEDVFDEVRMRSVIPTLKAGRGEKAPPDAPGQGGGYVPIGELLQRKGK